MYRDFSKYSTLITSVDCPKVRKEEPEEGSLKKHNSPSTAMQGQNLGLGEAHGLEKGVTNISQKASYTGQASASGSSEQRRVWNLSLLGQV